MRHLTAPSQATRTRVKAVRVTRAAPAFGPLARRVAPLRRAACFW